MELQFLEFLEIFLEPIGKPDIHHVVAYSWSRREDSRGLGKRFADTTFTCRTFFPDVEEDFLLYLAIAGSSDEPGLRLRTRSSSSDRISVAKLVYQARSKEQDAPQSKNAPTPKDEYHEALVCAAFAFACCAGPLGGFCLGELVARYVAELVIPTSVNYPKLELVDRIEWGGKFRGKFVFPFDAYSAVFASNAWFWMVLSNGRIVKKIWQFAVHKIADGIVFFLFIQVTAVWAHDSWAAEFFIDWFKYSQPDVRFVIISIPLRESNVEEATKSLLSARYSRRASLRRHLCQLRDVLIGRGNYESRKIKTSTSFNSRVHEFEPRFATVRNPVAILVFTIYFNRVGLIRVAPSF